MKKTISLLTVLLAIPLVSGCSSNQKGTIEIVDGQNRTVSIKIK